MICHLIVYYLSFESGRNHSQQFPSLPVLSMEYSRRKLLWNEFETILRQTFHSYEESEHSCSQKMESTLPLPIVVNIASVSLHICFFTGMTTLLITVCGKKGWNEEEERDVNQFHYLPHLYSIHLATIYAYNLTSRSNWEIVASKFLSIATLHPEMIVPIALESYVEFLASNSCKCKFQFIDFKTERICTNEVAWTKTSSSTDPRRLFYKNNHCFCKKSAVLNSRRSYFSGKVTPENEGRTIDDAASNWGAVQKVDKQKS